MPNVFDATDPPFDRLTSQEVETLRAALDIAYFRPGETIIAQNAPASALFVVIKGTVEERDGGDLQALLGPKDSFNSRALVHDRSGHAFVAREETLCYTCPKGVTLGLIQSNPRFASFFYREISHKPDELARDEEERRYGSLMRARVSELFLHPPAFCPRRWCCDARRSKHPCASLRTTIDLSFAAILKDLGIPLLAQHDAFNDALMSAMMYVTLRDLKDRDVRATFCGSRRRATASGDPVGEEKSSSLVRCRSLGECTFC